MSAKHVMNKSEAARIMEIFFNNEEIGAGIHSPQAKCQNSEAALCNAPCSTKQDILHHTLVPSFAVTRRVALAVKRWGRSLSSASRTLAHQLALHLQSAMDDLAFALQAQQALEQQSQPSHQLSPTSQQFSSQGSQPSPGATPRPSGVGS
eukprot:1160962-Pelagomonas_calceolata.AAC.12